MRWFRILGDRLRGLFGRESVNNFLSSYKTNLPKKLKCMLRRNVKSVLKFNKKFKN
jgi:hypothetical protein